MNYTMTRGMYELDGELVCDIRYDILATKYVKNMPSTDELGEVVLVSTDIDFVTPVQFDTGSKTIPYGLYLLIEQYRLTKSPEILEQINGALTQFTFQGSLSEFVLQVDSIE
jgi:hypothetical protein